MLSRAKSAVQTLGRWIRRNRLLVTLIVAVPAGVALLLVVLGPLSWFVGGETVNSLKGKSRADALNSVRQTVLTAIGGASVLASLAYTARSYSLSRRGQVTERFRAAVEQLASGDLEVRLGSVYSLEHVLRESAQEHVTVVNVLAAFVRNRAQREDRHFPWAFPEERNPEAEMPPWGTEQPADIQAAVNVLARRPERPEQRRVDLRLVDLTGLSARHFEFETPPRLDWMFLTAADLSGADLRGAVFARSILTNAELRRAWLREAQLDYAQLGRADLRRADLQDATLIETGLQGADLRDCVGLTARQISVANIDEKTRLPEPLVGDQWVARRLAECEEWAATRGTRECPPPTPPSDSSG